VREEAPSITVSLFDIQKVVEQFTPKPSTETEKQIKQMIETIKDAKNLNEDQLKKAALLLGPWFSGSDKHEKEGIWSNIIRNIGKLLTIYLFTSKGGPLASSVNTPDLGEMIFLWRIREVVEKLTLVDEFPFFGPNIWGDSNSAFKERLSDLAKQFGIELEIKNIEGLYNKEKFNELNKFSSLEDEEFKERVEVLARALIRGNGGIDLSIIKKIIEFIAIMQSRRPEILEDSLHLSVVRGEGKLNIGWPFGLLPIHGVPLIFEHKGKMTMQIVPENELKIANEILKDDKEIKISKVVDEHDNFLAFAIKRKGNIEEKDVLLAVRNALEKRAKDGSVHHPITEILEELGVPKEPINAINKELEEIKKAAIESLDKTLKEAKETLKTEDAHIIESLIKDVNLSMTLRK
jgi:hypothetical protein